MRRGLWVIGIAAAVACAVACSDGDDVSADAGAGRWSSAPAVVGGAIQETAAASLAGRVYVVGGITGAGIVSSRVAVFDVAASSWSTGPALPFAVHHANVAVVDGTVLVLGALTGGDFAANGTTLAWSPATDATWSEREPMPVGSERGAAVTGVIDGLVYVAGGFRNGAVSEVSIYDPNGDTWTPGPGMPARRDHACGGVIGAVLYVAGGRDTSIDSIVASVDVFDPSTGWSSAPSMPTARGGGACGVVRGRLVVVGGEGNTSVSSGVFEQVEAYDPSVSEWSTLDAMPTPRHGMAAASHDGSLYVPGGATVQGFGAVDVHEVLSL